MKDNYLDTVLMHSNIYPDWTYRNAVEGVQIFGGIGSGKTSGSGKFLAHKYLKAGFGGLVLTAKPDEKDTWVEYARQTNRLQDLIIVEPKGKYNFNFLSYETSRADNGVGITANLVHIFKTVINASSENTGQGKSQDPFWDTALDMYLLNIFDLARIAFGRIDFDTIYMLANSLPNKIEQLKDEQFQKESFFAKTLIEKLIKRIDDKSLSDTEIYQFSKIEDYFYHRHIPLSEKTRSIIEYSLDGLLTHFSREPIYSMFCKGKSNFTPEDSINGKIIILNIPVKIYDKVGRDIQIMFKLIWQRAMERRKVLDKTPPVFLWADESQNFLHENDTDFQATARSSRVCTTYLSQNLPNYFANMGGLHGKDKVSSFLGTLGTKIFHANSDVETNEFASKLIGEYLKKYPMEGFSYGKNMNTSISYTMQRERVYPVEDFVKLKTGAAQFDKQVEAIIHLHRSCIKDGNSYSHYKLTFNQ